MIDKATLDYAVDLFSGMGGVSAKRMFGGAGLYSYGVMFALIDDDRIFLKTDEALRADLVAEGSVGWIYTKGPEGWPQETSYWSLPELASEDPDEACAWGRRALAVAAAIKAAAQPKRRRGVAID